jgi:hypothetical protein
MSALIAEGLRSLPQEATLTIANDNLKFFYFFFYQVHFEIMTAALPS